MGVGLAYGAGMAFVFQSHAFEWGGMLRFGALFLLIFSTSWLGLQVRQAQRIHERGHSRRLLTAGLWGVLVILLSGWFWIVPAQGHEVGWLWTSLVAAVAVVPLIALGADMARKGSR